MACKHSIPAIISGKPRSLGRHVHARSLAAVLMLGAGVALSAVTAAVSSATAQELEWATQAGGDGGVGGSGVAVHPRGNSYVTGFFRDTATFGVGEANQTQLSNDSNMGVFVAKYAADGTLVWATSGASSTLSVQASDIALDRRGNSYLSGTFRGTATFGAGEANETRLEAPANPNMFVAKYAPDGTLLWAKGAGGTDATVVVAQGIAANAEGDSYVTGNFSARPAGRATFGAGESNETHLEAAGPAGLSDLFVAKYAPDGTLLWATSAGGSSEDEGQGIALDRRGNSYVTGFFQGTATFGVGEANETQLQSTGFEEILVAKYAPDGTLLWATSAGGATGDQAQGIALDPPGNSYVTGHFQGAATFGAGEANETPLQAAGTSNFNADIFVAKYGPDGILLWAKRAGGPAFGETGLAIATDPRGNSYVTGITGLSESLFVAKYARDGTLLWAIEPFHHSGGDIAADPRGNSYVVGSFIGAVTFGAGEANETVLEAGQSGDLFVAKYDSTNDQHQCPDPDLSPTVVLDGNDTGVDNVLIDNSCSIMDLILQASDEATSRSEFLRAVALLTRTLLNDGLITAEEAGILRTAASQATFPLS